MTPTRIVPTPEDCRRALAISDRVGEAVAELTPGARLALAAALWLLLNPEFDELRRRDG